MRSVFSLIAVLSISLSSTAQEGDWEIAKPPKEAGKAPQVELKGDKIVLIDRGMIRTKKQFKRGSTTECTWKYVGGQDKGSYQDVLSIITRTHGKQREKRSHEIENGVMIQFAAHAQTISIQRFSSKKVSSNLIARIPAKIERGKEHKILIHDQIFEDKGGLVAIHFDGRLVLEAAVNLLDEDGDYVAVYNRERGPASQISILSGLSIK